MASEKTYKWMKLQNDFFSSKRIKMMRRMENGDTLVLIYLKLQLHSLCNDGVVTYDGFSDTFEQELSVDIGENENAVKRAVEFLIRAGLMVKTSENTYLLPFVEECTGKDDKSAERTRRYRERQKEAHQKDGVKVPFCDKSYDRLRYNGNYYKVMERDDYKCAVCGSTEDLCVHHIIGYKKEQPENNALNKMACLCDACHRNAHRQANNGMLPENVLQKIGFYES